MSEVNFSNREMFDRIDRKLDSIDSKLENKAERARVHQIANEMMAAEGRSRASIEAISKEMRMWEERLLKLEAQLTPSLVLEAIEKNRTRASTQRTTSITTSVAIISTIIALISTALVVYTAAHKNNPPFAQQGQQGGP